MRLLAFLIMSQKRTARRAQDRKLRQLVRDRERLAALEVGGSKDRPIAVDSASVVEVRVGRLACPQCRGEYKVKEHTSPASGLRCVRVTCMQCGVSRALWFRIVSHEAN